MTRIAPLPVRMLTLAAVVSVVAAPALVTASSSVAAPGGPDSKVRICHRTSAVTNPYVAIRVARSSVDGDQGNDGGQGDHYLNHTGPIWTPQAQKGDDWGDIIPPLPGVHEGRNWTPLGQAIWTAGCRPLAATDSDGDRVPDVVDPDTEGAPDAEVPDAEDTDGDGVTDRIDSDDDGDGITDNAECEPKPAADPTAPEPTAPEPTASEPAPTASEPAPTGNNAATGVGQTTNGAGAPRTLCTDDGPVPPKDESTSDPDRDGRPNDSDRDDDGDGNPDVTDPDDDGDGVPDPFDRDDPPVEPGSVVDTDGDGTPDLRDRDDDGDGVADTRDKDADGDGQPEVTPQPLVDSVVLPARIDVGEPTVLWDRQPRTVAGVPAAATIRCTSAFRGDVVASSRSLCDVATSPSKGTVTVRGIVPTIVTVVFASPAVGEYQALNEVRTYRVRP